MNATGEEFRPVFVVGCERSGTTLLAVLLGRHSSIAMMPESHFFRIIKRGRMENPPPREQMLHDFFTNWTSANLGLDEKKISGRFSSYGAGYDALLHAAMEEFAATQGKVRCGEKTPLHLQNVATLVKWFPQARIVGIVRDGRDVVLSLLEMPWTVDKRVRATAWRWAKLLKMTRKWEAAYPKHFLLMRYEDLLLQPAETLRKVDAFIAETFEEGQLNPQVDTYVVNVQKETWKADAVREIDPTRIAGWKKKATPQQLRLINSTIGEELRSCGYTETEVRLTLSEHIARTWYRSGLFDLWERVAKHLPAARARRRAARKS